MGLTIAVEVGYTQVRAILLDLGGTASRKLPRIEHTASQRINFNEMNVEYDLVETVLAIADTVAADRRAEVAGLGVACAAAVSPAGTLRWTGVRQGALAEEAAEVEQDYPFLLPLRLGLKRLFPQLREVAVANRAAMAAWGEYKYGWGTEGKDSLVYLHAGGGVGAGMVIQGRLYEGAYGFAGAFGHMLVDPTSDVVCDICHQMGCLSSLVGGAATLKRLEAQQSASGAEELITYLGEHPTQPGKEAGYVQQVNGTVVDARSVADAAMKRAAVNLAYPLAHEIIRGFVVPLGRAIGQIICLVDPHLVVLGGIISNSKWLEIPLDAVTNNYIPTFRQTMHNVACSMFRDLAQEVEGLSGDEAPLFGVADWVWDHNVVQ